MALIDYLRPSAGVGVDRGRNLGKSAAPDGARSVNEKIGKNRLLNPLSEVLSGALSIVSLKLSDCFVAPPGTALSRLIYRTPTPNMSNRASYLFKCAHPGSLSLSLKSVLPR